MRRGTLATLAADYTAMGEPRGEIVIVIGPPAEAEKPSAAQIDALIRNALARLSVKDAVSEIATATGLPRREVYQRALELSGEDGEG
jgi:16S rRNA (cytidine1402-2'-O)-methyltransferase